MAAGASVLDVIYVLSPREYEMLSSEVWSAAAPTEECDVSDNAVGSALAGCGFTLVQHAG